MNDPNLVPEPVNALIEVFEAQLPDVEFPGVSAQLLRSQATTVDEAARAVAEAETALKQARSAHAEAFAALRAAAERGMGYARVYATDDETLTQALGAIELKPARTRRLPPKKRARKPKAKPDNVAELPLAAETA